MWEIMCFAKLVPGDYSNEDAVEREINYIYNPSHATSGYYGGVAVSYLNPEITIEQFKAVKRIYHKEDGRQIKHLVVSFAKNEHVSAKKALEIGYIIAEYFNNRYQIYFGVHENEEHIHIHFGINTVSYIDGKKYSAGPYEQDEIRKYIEAVTGFRCRWYN